MGKQKEADGTHKSRLVVQGWFQVLGTTAAAASRPYADLRVPTCDADDRGGTGTRVVHPRRPDGISERRRGGKRFSQDDPRLRNGRQVRTSSCHESQDEFVRLRQSPKNWFGTMDHHLAEIGNWALPFLRCTCMTFFYWARTSSC